MSMNTNEKRSFQRIIPEDSILVKEDTGSFINYYHLGDISEGGMFLLKKISSKEEQNASYTFMIPELQNPTIEGKILETRMSDGIFGTAVRFNDNSEPVKNIIEKLQSGFFPKQ